MNGFVPVPRSVLESEWWTAATPLTRNLWLVLFAGANWKSGVTARGLGLQPGQLVTSWRELACRCSWVENKGRREPPITNVRRAADFLRNAREVTWTPAGCRNWTGIVVTLSQWAVYVNADSDAAASAAATSADGLPEPRQHMKKNYGPAERQTPADPQSTLGQRQEWLRAEREGWETH